MNRTHCVHQQIMHDSSIVTISKDLTTKYSSLNKFYTMTECKYKLEV